MSVRSYTDLRHHVGHQLACVGYGAEQTDLSDTPAAGGTDFHTVAIECVTCGHVLVEFDQALADTPTPRLWVIASTLPARQFPTYWSNLPVSDPFWELASAAVFGDQPSAAAVLDSLGADAAPALQQLPASVALTDGQTDEALYVIASTDQWGATQFLHAALPDPGRLLWGPLDHAAVLDATELTAGSPALLGLMSNSGPVRVRPLLLPDRVYRRR